VARYERDGWQKIWPAHHYRNTLNLASESGVDRLDLARFNRWYAPVVPTLSSTCCGDVWICTRVYGASAFCVYELQVKNYGKDLANSNWSTPLSESRARNLSSPLFVF
jgi:hypothetical protein